MKTTLHYTDGRLLIYKDDVLAFTSAPIEEPMRRVGLPNSAAFTFLLIMETDAPDGIRDRIIAELVETGSAEFES